MYSLDIFLSRRPNIYKKLEKQNLFLVLFHWLVENVRLMMAFYSIKKNNLADTNFLYDQYNRSLFQKKGSGQPQVHDYQFLSRFELLRQFPNNYISIQKLNCYKLLVSSKMPPVHYKPRKRCNIVEKN